MVLWKAVEITTVGLVYDHLLSKFDLAAAILARNNSERAVVFQVLLYLSVVASNFAELACLERFIWAC